MLFDSANAASIGRTKRQLETPALCLDLTVYERNVAAMVNLLHEQGGIGWRPHMKGQKAPQLAQRAVAAGALGVTCATVYEAQAMAEAGISSILIAHQTVGEHKLRRLASLQRLSEVISATDSEEHVTMLAHAAHQEQTVIPVLIEVNVGMARGGIAPGDPTRQLAERILATPGLRFRGLMGWEGHVLKHDGDAKQAAIDTAIRTLLDTTEHCRRAGFDVPIVSASGSGTFLLSTRHRGLTEVQAGGAVFSDLSYRRWGVPHDFALTILTRVSSRPSPTRIILDGGFKTMSQDHGLPEPLGLPPVRSISLSAEHGTIELAEPSATPRVGDILELLPGYTDSTVCLHDELCVLRDGVVQEVWTIPGRSGRR